MARKVSQVAGILDVHILQAEGLPNICPYGPQDVYVKVLCGDRDAAGGRVALVTKTVKGGGSQPIINQKLQVAIHERETELKCEVWMASHHRGTADDQLLGFANINIRDALAQGKHGEQTFVLSGYDSHPPKPNPDGSLPIHPYGIVRIAFTYHPRNNGSGSHLTPTSTAAPSPLHTPNPHQSSIASGALGRVLSAAVSRISAEKEKERNATHTAGSSGTLTPTNSGIPLIHTAGNPTFGGNCNTGGLARAGSAAAASMAGVATPSHYSPMASPSPASSPFPGYNSAAVTQTAFSLPSAQQGSVQDGSMTPVGPPSGNARVGLSTDLMQALKEATASVTTSASKTGPTSTPVQGLPPPGSVSVPIAGNHSHSSGGNHSGGTSAAMKMLDWEREMHDVSEWAAGKRRRAKSGPLRMIAGGLGSGWESLGERQLGELYRKQQHKQSGRQAKSGPLNFQGTPQGGGGDPMECSSMNGHGYRPASSSPPARVRPINPPSPCAPRSATPPATSTAKSRSGPLPMLNINGEPVLALPGAAHAGYHNPFTSHHGGQGQAMAFPHSGLPSPTGSGSNMVTSSGTGGVTAPTSAPHSSSTSTGAAPSFPMLPPPRQLHDLRYRSASTSSRPIGLGIVFPLAHKEPMTQGAVTGNALPSGNQNQSQCPQQNIHPGAGQTLGGAANYNQAGGDTGGEQRIGGSGYHQQQQSTLPGPQHQEPAMQGGGWANSGGHGEPHTGSNPFESGTSGNNGGAMYDSQQQQQQFQQQQPSQGWQQRQESIHANAFPSQPQQQQQFYSQQDPTYQQHQQQQFYSQQQQNQHNSLPAYGSQPGHQQQGTANASNGSTIIPSHIFDKISDDDESVLLILPDSSPTVEELMMMDNSTTGNQGERNNHPQHQETHTYTQPANIPPSESLVHGQMQRPGCYGPQASSAPVNLAASNDMGVSEGLPLHEAGRDEDSVRLPETAGAGQLAPGEVAQGVDREAVGFNSTMGGEEGGLGGDGRGLALTPSFESSLLHFSNLPDGFDTEEWNEEDDLLVSAPLQGDSNHAGEGAVVMPQVVSASATQGPGHISGSQLAVDCGPSVANNGPLKPLSPNSMTPLPGANLDSTISCMPGQANSTAFATQQAGYRHNHRESNAEVSLQQNNRTISNTSTSSNLSTGLFSVVFGNPGMDSPAWDGSSMMGPSAEGLAGRGEGTALWDDRKPESIHDGSPHDALAGGYHNSTPAGLSTPGPKVEPLGAHAIPTGSPGYQSHTPLSTTQPLHMPDSSQLSPYAASPHHQRSPAKAGSAQMARLRGSPLKAHLGGPGGQGTAAAGGVVGNSGSTGGGVAPGRAGGHGGRQSGPARQAFLVSNDGQIQSVPLPNGPQQKQQQQQQQNHQQLQQQQVLEQQHRNQQYAQQQTQGGHGMRRPHQPQQQGGLTPSASFERRLAHQKLWQKRHSHTHLNQHTNSNQNVGPNHPGNHPAVTGHQPQGQQVFGMAKVPQQQQQTQRQQQSQQQLQQVLALHQQQQAMKQQRKAVGGGAVQGLLRGTGRQGNAARQIHPMPLETVEEKEGNHEEQDPQAKDMECPTDSDIMLCLSTDTDDLLSSMATDGEESSHPRSALNSSTVSVAGGNGDGMAMASVQNPEQHELGPWRVEQQQMNAPFHFTAQPSKVEPHYNM